MADAFNPDLILYIERQENVNGDSLAKYLMEFMLEMLENHQTREVHEEQEEVVLADPRDVEYPNELEIDNQENQLTTKRRTRWETKMTRMKLASQHRNQGCPTIYPRFQ
ncbi:hypothetical protein B9Z55_021502 [Caenorhabditis nigoni]|uniref:Uncharacterized protein n=1 Tax=Caenorhabditis nigoni TaxID=1611254 RepID=A0A2G5TSD9_9PELO|nr:hypothetical protein B9Z55_021502 [Caenorhabditis nigoni]